MSSKQILKRMRFRSINRFQSNVLHFPNQVPVLQFQKNRQLSLWFKSKPTPDSKIIIEEPNYADLGQDQENVEMLILEIKDYLKTDSSFSQYEERENLSRKILQVAESNGVLRFEHLSTLNSIYKKLVSKPKDLSKVMSIDKWENLFVKSVGCLTPEDSLNYPFIDEMFRYFLKIDNEGAIVGLLEYTMLTQDPKLFQNILSDYLRRTNNSETTSKLCSSLIFTFQKRELAELEVFLKISELFSEYNCSMSDDFITQFEGLCGTKDKGNQFTSYEIEKSANALVKFVLSNKSVTLNNKIQLLKICQKYGLEKSHSLIIDSINDERTSIADYFKDTQDFSQFRVLETCIKFGKSDLGEILKTSIESNTYTQPEVILIPWEIYKMKEGDLSTIYKSLENLESKMDDKVMFSEVLMNCIEAAIHSKKSDSFIRELQLHLESEYSIEYNGKYYSVLLQREIQKKNREAVMKVFQKSVSDGISWGSKENIPYAHTINDVMVYLCESSEDVKESLSELKKWYNKLREHIGQLNYKAVSAVVKKMADNDFGGDAVYLLREAYPDIKKESADKLPLSECSEILQSLLRFIHRYTQDLNHGWFVLIEIHRIFFPPYETYFPLIKFYVKHVRLEYAITVFKKLIVLNQLHGHPGPSPEIYSFLLRQLGNRYHINGVVDVHNYLKMDLVVEQDINLMNSILYAYASVQESRRAREIFSTIQTIPKERGLNEETITIMLQHYGENLEQTQDFWNSLSSYGILPNEEIYRQYLLAYCWADKSKEACELVEGMKDYELAVTPSLIASLYNYSHPDRGQREIVEEWAKEEYPNEWEKVKESGSLMTDNEIFLSFYGEVLEGDEKVSILDESTTKLLL